MAAPFWVYLCPIEPSGYCDRGKEIEVARFWAKGDATAYAIWRATNNNEPLHVFEVRRGNKTVYRAGLGG